MKNENHAKIKRQNAFVRSPKKITKMSIS